MKKTTWADEVKNLGKDPDIRIAERMGISRERVRQKRKALGIAPPPRAEPLRTAHADERSFDPASLLCQTGIPLSAEHRQLITDRRLALGLRQQELAERLGYSLTGINWIETGRRRPRPEFLTAICDELGLEYAVEFHVTLGVATSKPKR